MLNFKTTKNCFIYIFRACTDNPLIVVPDSLCYFAAQRRNNRVSFDLHICAISKIFMFVGIPKSKNFIIPIMEESADYGGAPIRII